LKTATNVHLKIHATCRSSQAVDSYHKSHSTVCPQKNKTNYFLA